MELFLLLKVVEVCPQYLKVMGFATDFMCDLEKVTKCLIILSWKSITKLPLTSVVQNQGLNLSGPQFPGVKWYFLCATLCLLSNQVPVLQVVHLPEVLSRIRVLDCKLFRIGAVSSYYRFFSVGSIQMHKFSKPQYKSVRLALSWFKRYSEMTFSWGGCVELAEIDDNFPPKDLCKIFQQFIQPSDFTTPRLSLSTKFREGIKKLFVKPQKSSLYLFLKLSSKSLVVFFSGEKADT